jgi:hypothetical protein
VSNAVDELFGSFTFKSCARKEPRAVWQRMIGMDVASLGRMTECGAADAQKLGCFREIHPIGGFSINGLVARDFVFAAQ